MAFTWTRRHAYVQKYLTHTYKLGQNCGLKGVRYFKGLGHDSIRQSRRFYFQLAFFKTLIRRRLQFPKIFGRLLNCKTLI